MILNSQEFDENFYWRLILFWYIHILHMLGESPTAVNMVRQKKRAI